MYKSPESIHLKSKFKRWEDENRSFIASLLPCVRKRLYRDCVVSYDRLNHVKLDANFWKILGKEPKKFWSWSICVRDLPGLIDRTILGFRDGRNFKSVSCEFHQKSLHLCIDTHIETGKHTFFDIIQQIWQCLVVLFHSGFKHITLRSKEIFYTETSYNSIFCVFFFLTTTPRS